MKNNTTLSLGGSRSKTKANIIRIAAMVLLVVPALIFTQRGHAQKQSGTISIGPPIQQQGESKTFAPIERPMMVFPSINLRQVARQQALESSQLAPAESRAIHAPKGDVPPGRRPVALPAELSGSKERPSVASVLAPLASTTGISPPPSQTFKGQELLGNTIPPDTGGAVGTTHIITATNDRLRILDRNGVVLSTVTLSSFWSGVSLEGGASVVAFDPKVMFDRFNNRFIFVASANPQSLSSAVLIAVTQTADPNGVWFRYAIDGDPAATAAGGHWIDYPTIGHNKNWIVIMENTFNFGTAGSSFFGPQVYVINKQNAYTGPVSLMSSLFEGSFTGTCITSGTPQLELACGFTMAPAITEDNTTDTEYLVEDWDNVAAQLRLSKITGTAAVPVLTVGTQFPQSTNSWRFGAGITPSGSGGYLLQRQQAAYLTSSNRPAANDSRIQNAVYRNGSLWATHTVMLSTTPLAAGTDTSTANPHNHAGIQWWEIDPTIANSTSGTLPLQRARIQDPTADNCNNNAGAARPGCTPQGQFFAFPHITVNQNDDVLIGYSRFSERTYASAAYSFRAGTDPINTMRDSIVFRPGQSNYNIGAGSPFTVRWGDMSHAQVDPINDTDFWTTQEYADVNRALGLGIVGTWSTWWARVSPNTPAPSTTGHLIISEFRVRGPQGPRDEFVELYNPGTSPLVVTTADGSDGWALAYSSNGTAITAVTTIPVGTVIPAKGHFLITGNQVNPITASAVYSLTGAPNTAFRDSGGDTGYAIDNPDNGGFAIFKTSNPANFVVGTRMDSVGFSGIAAGLFREGAGLPPISTTNPTGQASHVRFIGRLGEPHDTGVNEADFIYVNPVNELSPTPMQGAAGPENLDSPRVQSSLVDSLVAPCIASTLAPNRVRVGSGNAGTLSIRRTLHNNTGGAVTRLRFRVVEITTAPAPDLATAILAVTSSSNSTEASPCGPSVTIKGLTLEDTPVPVQPQGGGQNSILSAGTITLATPLANGSSISVNFLTNVVKAGQFRFFVNVEALP
jgi:hypothetical protein